MESPSKSPEASRSPKSIEETANFEGLDSILTCERAMHPTIKRQIVDLLYREQKDYFNTLQSEIWEPYKTESAELIENDLLVGQKTGKMIARTELATPPPAREKIEKELDERIAHVSSVTEITFDTGETPHMATMPLDWDMPGQDEKPTVKQKAIALAHEKGHRIRPYFSEVLTLYFQRGFVISKMEFSEEDYKEHKRQAEIRGDETTSIEDAREIRIHYLFSAAEIAERMNQLKNYFGMKGDEQFTLEHLRYAKEHYVKDTKMDNHMTQLFQTITPETEAAFIEIINNAGI